MPLATSHIPPKYGYLSEDTGVATVCLGRGTCSDPEPKLLIDTKGVEVEEGNKTLGTGPE
jgi:hypothetical protein